jgi:hypothetical protein
MTEKKIVNWITLSLKYKRPRQSWYGKSVRYLCLKIVFLKKNRNYLHMYIELVPPVISHNHKWKKELGVTNHLMTVGPSDLHLTLWNRKKDLSQNA